MFEPDTDDPFEQFRRWFAEAEASELAGAHRDRGRGTDDEADAYYASRPRGSRIGAWASQQSRPLADRPALLAAVSRFEAEYDGKDVPRPPYWSGYRLTPLRVEFWQDGEFRLHDRFVFTRSGEGAPWTVQRLFP